MVGRHRDGDRAKLFTRRMALLGAGKGVLIGALVGRMYYLQVIEADKYRTLSDENRINLRLLPPPRGRIMDRFGEPLAINQQNFRVLLISEKIQDQQATLDALSNIIPLTDYDRQRIAREIRRKRSFVPVTIRENLTWEEMASIQVNAPDLPGIVIDEGLARLYPYGADVAHVLGYVASVSENDLTGDPLLELPGFRIGKDGIEREADLPLRGKGGNSQVEVNALGRMIRELSRTDGQPGEDVVLTIDIRIQEAASKALGEESGTVVVMDCMTGEVLAMVSQPAYDPNAFNRGLTNEEWKTLTSSPKSPLANKPIAGQYAPGSTFKMVVAMAAYEAGVIKPEQTVNCPGHMTMGNARFHCWKKGGHGNMDMVGALKNSCDVYFYEVARRLGIDRIADMARRFGLGAPTGVGLPKEKGGLIPDRRWKQAVMGDVWHPGESLVAGIGQGYITATPLQLAVMTSRIANGGLGIKPILTKMQIDGDHLVPRTPPTPPDLGVSRTAIQLAKRGMWEVVNGSYGTAWRVKLPPEFGADMAGKTGTAQVRRISKSERDNGVIKNEDLPWERRDHALFVCFAPYESPRYVISVVVEHGGGGSAVAAPIAQKIMMECLKLDPVGHTKDRAPSHSPQQPQQQPQQTTAQQAQPQQQPASDTATPDDAPGSDDTPGGMDEDTQGTE
ncbi:penicillin-binding protein 2 [Insolitispirillum peregrinum]|uniref:Peptidoglycan glycosyltransferase n=1 Tax=Insolitispirillum peregrinum TaxID=80876 RepID=A0A1N7PKW6_9PROT|nr:penicillin-binding protein 2 [Insolitispirillum peregrinum]SIT11232.1 peptidoglycan glycosyltransferase [Insolitispirillum peregrinum]